MPKNNASFIAEKLVLYQTGASPVSVKVRFDNDTAWLTLNQMADLFGRDKSVISRHLANIFNSKELKRKTTVADFATVQIEGGVEKTRELYTEGLSACGFVVNN